MKVLALVAVLVAGSASAQDRMSSAQCTESFNAVASLVALSIDAPDIAVTDDTWCSVSSAQIEVDTDFVLQIGTLRWRASDMDRFLNEGLPPRAVEIEGTGVQVLPQTGDPVLDYLLALQQSRSSIAFGLDVKWDGVQNAITVEDTFFAFDPTNRIEINALIDGANLTDTGTMQASLGTAGRRDLTMKADFDGWFETYVALTIGQTFLRAGDVTPQVQVEALKRQAIAFVEQLPDTFMPAPSRAAVSEFVIALPTPRGTAQAQIAADPILGAARMVPLGLAGRDATPLEIIETALDGVTMLFTWTPSGDAE